MSETPKHPTKFWVTTIVGVVSGLTVTVVGGLILNAVLGSQDSAEGSSVTQMEEPASSAVSTAEPDSEPSSRDPAPASAAGSTPVMLEDSVFNERCARPGNTGFPWKSSSPNIAGTAHGSGFSCAIAVDPAQGWLTFIVPEGATHLDVNAGQSMEATNTTVRLRFEVVDDISGAVLEAHDVAFGELASFHTPIAGVLRVSLRVTLLDHAGDFRSTSGDASWGDPAFSHQ